MSEAFRVTIGGEPNYLPPTDQKPAVAYVRLVENQRVFESDTKQWVDLDPVWRDGVFRGAAAEALTRDYQVGDPLVVAGASRMEANHKDGKYYTGEKLYVDSFGPDAMYKRVQVDRAPSQSVSQNVSQDASQGVQQSQWQEPGSEPATAATASAAQSSSMQQVMSAQPTAPVGFIPEPHAPEPQQPQQGYAM